MNSKLLATAALLSVTALACGPARAATVGATQELKEECVQRYGALLAKPALKTPDACWRSLGYLYDDATVAKYAAKDAADKLAAANKSAQR